MLDLLTFLIFRDEITLSNILVLYFTKKLMFSHPSQHFLQFLDICFFSYSIISSTHTFYVLDTQGLKDFTSLEAWQNSHPISFFWLKKIKSYKKIVIYFIFFIHKFKNLKLKKMYDFFFKFWQLNHIRFIKSYVCIKILLYCPFLM